MKRPFRDFHLFNILEAYEAKKLPMDVHLSHYFRAHKAVGAGDRRYISETVYGLIRWRGLLDHFLPKPPSWDSRTALFKEFNPLDHRTNAAIPLHIRASFPKPLFQRLCSHFGEERALELCYASNTAAPTTVRANLLKTTRDQLLEKWQGLYEVSACLHSNAGIVFHRKINFFALEEFKAGLFEIQDEASQLVAALVKPKAGDEVLDFCAGSGGKTLAFAPAMEGKGQIYLHDIRPFALEEAKKRLYRAGIQNAQVVLAEDPKLEVLKGRMNWVLVDAPCTGTGTLRRNPDMKWKLDLGGLEALRQEQCSIFEQALEYLSPKGHIVYATCSILPEENEEQMNLFKERFKLECVGPFFQSFPQKNGMDGFFGVVFKQLL
jgi:16S rRNA C967 or C1407 C5-methylase (RsmB/RsmF family)